MKHDEKIPCSVGILTFNSGTTLKKCLKSAQCFAEIIVCDGGSNDDTIQIAKQFGCKIIEQDKDFKNPDNTIADFSGVRNQTYNKATYDWFFYVDSDEYLSSEIVTEIRCVIESDTETSPKVYKTPRKFVLEGKIIECAPVYPNYHIRFFHKDFVSGFRKKVHEAPVIKDRLSMGVLKSPTYVPTSVDISALLKKQDYYLSIEKSRLSKSPNKLLYLGIYRNLCIILGRILKTIRCRFFCRGRQLPFRKDFLALRYHFKLILILISQIFSTK